MLLVMSSTGIVCSRQRSALSLEGEKEGGTRDITWNNQLRAIEVLSSRKPGGWGKHGCIRGTDELAIRL